MEQNDFYEVDGCTWFIPVDLIEENKCTKELEVVATESGRITFVPSIYKFRKPQEPEKVVVQKFVAEYIERCKRSGWHLQKALYRLDDDDKVGDWAYDENDDLIAEKVDEFARAWLAYPNITIEQEKLYTVEIPNNGGTLVLACVNQAIKLVDGNKHFPGKFTKESIESAGFGWLFDRNDAKVVEEENE